MKNKILHWAAFAIFLSPLLLSMYMIFSLVLRDPLWLLLVAFCFAYAFSMRYVAMEGMPWKK